MCFASGIRQGGIGHPIGAESTRRHNGQSRTSCATRTFARNRQAAGGSRGLSRERAGLENGVGIVPLHYAKRRCGGERTHLQTGGNLSAYVVGVAALGDLVD